MAKKTRVWVTDDGDDSVNFWSIKPTVFDKVYKFYDADENPGYGGSFCRNYVEMALQGTGIRLPEKDSRRVVGFDIVLVVEKKKAAKAKKKSWRE